MAATTSGAPQTGRFHRNPFSGIGVRLAATFLLVVLMVTIPLTIWLYQYAHDLIEERTQAVVASLLEHDHGLVAASVATHDYWQLFRLARSLAGPDYIASAAVLDEYGNLLAHSDPAVYGVYAPYSPPPDASAEYIPIMGLRGMIGELVLVWNHEAMSASFAPVRRAIVVVTGAFALLACLLGVAVALLWRSRLLRILGRAGAHQGMALHFAGSGGSPGGGQGNLSVRGDELDMLEHELIQAFDQLRLSEWILNSVQEYVLLIDSHGYIRHVNRQVEALWACGGCRGQHIRELCAGSDYAELARQLEERDSGTLETPLVICKYRFPALISFRRSDDMTVVTITDLTEYQDLKERVAKLRALSTLGEMSSELSHEIKNDIAPIKLLCQTASLPDEDKRVMLRSINRIDELVNDFMDFVRGDEQEVAVLSLREALKDCYGKFGNMAEEEGITLSVSTADMPVEIPPGGFRMVVANLVRNAIQMVPPGGRVWVEARVAPDGATELVVSDNGPGVAPHIRDRLFEPFVTGREGGTGLGLALVYRHMIQMGGSIDHAPREGGGTVFTVRWPPRVPSTVQPALRESPLAPAAG
jgi:signal transduction histidine kinase